MCIDKKKEESAKIQKHELEWNDGCYGMSGQCVARASASQQSRRGAVAGSRVAAGTPGVMYESPAWLCGVLLGFSFLFLCFSFFIFPFIFSLLLLLVLLLLFFFFLPSSVNRVSFLGRFCRLSAWFLSTAPRVPTTYENVKIQSINSRQFLSQSFYRGWI